MRQALLLTCMLAFGASCANAGPEKGIPFFHRHKKEAAKTTMASAAKPKRSFLHRGEPTREEAARSEAAYGMTGPRSVGFWHKGPGPAGVGAN
jgi:hypothetical protein